MTVFSKDFEMLTSSYKHDANCASSISVSGKLASMLTV